MMCISKATVTGVLEDTGCEFLIMILFLGFRFCGMYCCVGGFMFPDIWFKPSAFVRHCWGAQEEFLFGFLNPEDEGVGSFETSGNSNQQHSMTSQMTWILNYTAVETLLYYCILYLFILLIVNSESLCIVCFWPFGINITRNTIMNNNNNNDRSM